MTARRYAATAQAWASTGTNLIGLAVVLLLTACSTESRPAATAAAPAPPDVRRYRIGDVFSFDAPRDLGFSDTAPAGTSAGVYWGGDMWFRFVLGDARQRFLFGSEVKDVLRRDETIGGIPASVVSYRLREEPYAERWVEAIFHLSSNTTLWLQVQGPREDATSKQLALVRSVTFAPSARTTVASAGQTRVCMRGDYCFDAPSGLDWRQTHHGREGAFIRGDEITIGFLWTNHQPQGDRGSNFKRVAEHVDNVPVTIATYDLKGSEWRYNLDAWFRHADDDIHFIHVETMSLEARERGLKMVRSVRFAERRRAAP